ncbi:tetratricopeptide repeat protein [Sphingomonas parva]|uniref:Tetratricopeptide repeat protein n=1 Tax=Sphingomonas parva TaxID=2555898 RepID=A0A4Y8ZPH7_9SPHN|nr:tetratricopeptide repeat protein [Sphingomonas parva]TFI57920.1 tetratricopeptide repeat protein [Sphingomonas parva]
MAIKPADNESFYREVDEELRRDQMRTLWERYGKLAILAVVLILAAIAGVIWWKNQQQVKAGKQGQELLAAFDDVAQGKKSAAGPRFDALAKSDSPGYRAAGLLTKADLAIEANNLDAAAALFQQVSRDESLDQNYRDLALIRLTHVQFDKLAPQAVVDRLKGFAVAGHPWFGSAGEMVAISYLKLNKPNEAGKIFAALAKDKKVPDSLRSRATQMAGSLGIDAVEDSAATQEAKQ